MSQNTLATAPLNCGTADTIEGKVEECISAASIRFKLLKGELDLLNSRLRNDEQKNDGTLEDRRLEAAVDRLHFSMQGLSFRVSKIPSKCFADLRAKAEIWLERWIPDEGDDIGCLAESICKDVMSPAFDTTQSKLQN